MNGIRGTGVAVGKRLLHSPSRLLVGAAVLLLLVIGVVVAVVDPFAGKASGGASVADNGAPTARNALTTACFGMPPLLSGSGKFGTPWERMQAE